MIKQIKLFNQGNSFSDRESWPADTWWLCASDVREYFDLPYGLDEELLFKHIFFTLHKRPSKNRVKLELVDDEISIDGKVHTYWEPETQDAIVKLLKKHGILYVECDYQ